MTNSSRALRHAVRFTLAAVATTVGGPLALAQTAPASTPAAPAPSVQQEVVVTGSRIQQNPNDISISPVTSVTSAEIQQTGLLRTEDLLNSLPQVVAEASSGQSISSTGNATISLRGLGSSRTMVLINGRRMAPGAALGFASEPDINQIPSDLIERADVLTGGASAVYGADAVAGVVNFVMNTHYEGVKLDADYGFNQHKNNNAADLALLTAGNVPLPPGTVDTGIEKKISFIAGSNFADGKGNATAYFSYFNQGSAVGKQFDHAACTLNGNKLNGPPHCGGSSTSGTGRFYALGQVSGHSTTVVDNTVDQATNNFRAYHGLTDSYNYGALSYFQRPAERYAAGAFLNYDVNDHVNVYSETMFARNTSQAQYGPSGSFFGQSVFTVSCANPLLTASEQAAFCNPTTLAQNQAQYPGTPANSFQTYIGRRNVEGGGRQDNYTQYSIRQVLGAKGKINDAWSYDVYGQVSFSASEDIEGNFLGQQQVINALDVIPNPATAADPTKGVIPGVPVGGAVCASAVNKTATTCVPWNIWNVGGVTPAQLAYLTVPSSYTVRNEEYITDASVTGDLGKYGVKIPSAASGMVVNVGAEYREEKYDFDPDYIYGQALAEGGLSSPTHAVHGQFHVSEVFTEMRLPIIDEAPGAYQLAAEGGYRYSKYTSGFSTSTYKFGVEWAPVQDLRLRGSYNRAVRAPNILDLYNPAAIGAGGTADPCWGPTPNFTAAQCANTGVTAAQYGHILVNPAAQINTSAGGNTALTPEVADTYALGFVFQPQFVPNLILSVDYYSIKIKETITNLAASTIINNCAVNNIAALCGLIHRGTGGSLWIQPTAFVNANSQNIGSVSTKGIDLKVGYRMDIGGMGKLGWDLVGTRVSNFLTEPLPGLGTYDCAGYAGQICGSPTPKWRHNLTMNWLSPWQGLDITLKWRYIGTVNSDRTSPDKQLSDKFYQQTSHIGGYSYFDLSASLPVTSQVAFRIGVNNIADKNPPAVWNGTYTDCPTATCNDNTWVGTYDTLGRYLYAHVTAKF